MARELYKLKALAKSTIRDLYFTLQYPKPQKVLFDHLPKCGGSTVKQHLRSQYRYRKVYHLDVRDPLSSVMAFQALPEATRFDYDLVLGHRAYDLINFVHPDTIMMTIFRDPVERIISHYHYVKQDVGNYLHEIVTSNDMTLEEYATSGISRELRNWYVTHFLEVSADEAESRPDWSISQAHKIIMDKYDVVGFLDDLVTAMNTLEGKAGFRKQFQNAYLNTTANRPKRDEIDPSVLDSIKQVNFLDIELYNRLKNESENGNRGV